MTGAGRWGDAPAYTPLWGLKVVRRLMRKVAGLVCFVALSACSDQVSIAGSTFVHIDSDWTSNPPDEPARERVASATALLFLPDGTFVEHHFYVREIDGLQSISPGDPHLTAIGKWAQTSGQITVSRTKVARTVPETPGPDSLCAASLGVAFNSPDDVRFEEQVFVRSATGLAAPSAHAEYIREAQKGSVCGAGV